MNQEQHYADEITLKELILRMQEYVRYLWGRRWWIVLSGLLGGCLFGAYAYLQPVTYTAELTFMVNEDEGGRAGGIASILGQFGFGGAKKSSFNLERIVALSRSKSILDQLVLDSISIYAKQDLLANHLIELLQLDERWEDHHLLSGFRFNSNEWSSFTEKENSALDKLYKIIGGSDGTPGLCKTAYNDETGILSIKTETEHQPLSIVICEYLYEELSAFYISRSVEQQRLTYEVLQAKVDSVYGMLKVKEYELARFRDRSQGLLLEANRVENSLVYREVQMLSIMYAESVKNLETADFLLRNATPVFQPIDWPRPPAKINRKSIPVYFILGVVLFGIMTTIIVLGRYLVNQVMRAE